MMRKKNRINKLSPEFVEYVPETLSDGIIYISIPFVTASHKCCCGCGQEVVTPISPTDWTLIYNGETVSLDPSIGNWSFDCRSHYWITCSRVRWAHKWTEKEIEAGRDIDRENKETYYAQKLLSEKMAQLPEKKGRLKTLWKWASSKKSP